MGQSISIPITVTKTGILRYIPVKQLYDHTMKKSPRKSIKVEICKELEASKDFSANAMKRSSSYFVGDFGQNPLQYAYINMSKFQNAYTERIFRGRAEGWKTDASTIQNLGINITSTVDFHPFPITFPDKHKTKKSKTITKEKQNIWKLEDEDHKYSHLMDSIGQNMPFLTRTLNGKTRQSLLMVRDIHPDMSAITNINRVFEVFKPTKVILECPTDPSFLKQYITRKTKTKSVIFKYYHHMINKDKNKTKFRPDLVHKFGVSSSFAIDTAIRIAIQQKIPVLSSDYPGLLNVFLKEGAETLDIYSAMMKWHIIGFPVEQFIKCFPDELMPVNLKNYGIMKLMPHFHVMCSHRDDMMSLAINESKEEKLLFIAGDAHRNGVIKRLSGNSDIYNPFKAVHINTIWLKDIVPNMKETELNDQDIEYLKNANFTEDSIGLFLADNSKLNKELFKKLKSTKGLLSKKRLNELKLEWEKRMKQKNTKTVELNKKYIIKGSYPPNN